MDLAEAKNRNGSSRGKISQQGGLAEFWDCLDNAQREELLTIQRQDVLDQVTCPSCRQLLGSAMEALEEESKGSIDPPGAIAPSKPKDKAGPVLNPLGRHKKVAAKSTGGPAPAPATKAPVSKALARPIKPPPPPPVRQPLLRRLDDGAFVSLQSMKNSDAEEGTEFVAYVGGHFELAQSRAQDASIRQHLMRPGSSAVPPPCYCEDKLNIRFVDMLTYPRPIRKFHLLLDCRMPLRELRELLAAEVLIESLAMLVLLVRGKPLRPENDALPLEQLGLKTGTLVVVSRVLGAPAEEGAGIDDKNKQFVGDLLFGNASGPGVTALGQGPVTSGNSSSAAAAAAGGSGSAGSAGSRNGGGESTAAAPVGGASGDGARAAGDEGNGAVGQSLPWGGGVVGSHSINHGCQILGRALDNIAKARVVGAWEAELQARQHEADLLAELEAEADGGAGDGDNAKSRSRRKKEKEKKRREALRVKEKKLEDERTAARDEKARLEQERVERERRERLEAERRQQQKREEEWMAAQVERQRKELEALTQERAKQQQREAAEQKEKEREEEWLASGRKEQQQQQQQQKAPPSPAQPPPQQPAASKQAKQRQTPQPQQQQPQQAKGAAKKDKRKKGDAAAPPAPGIVQVAGAQKAAAAKPVANGGVATKGRAQPAPAAAAAAAAPNAAAAQSPAWQQQQQQPVPRAPPAHALPQPHAHLQQPPQQAFVAAVPLFCSGCGTRISVAGARFCAFCGASLAGGAAPVATAAAGTPVAHKMGGLGAGLAQLDISGNGSNGLQPGLHGGFSLGVGVAPAAAGPAGGAPAAVPAWLGGGTHQLGSYTGYGAAAPPQPPQAAPARPVNGVAGPPPAATTAGPISPPPSGEREQQGFAAAPGKKVSPRALPLFQRLRQGTEDASGGGGGGGRGGHHGSGHMAALLSS